MLDPSIFFIRYVYLNHNGIKNLENISSCQINWLVYEIQYVPIGVKDTLDTSSVSISR